MLPTDAVPSRRPRLVLVAGDVIANTMAGPGLRFVKIAEQLSAVADVTIALGHEGSNAAALADMPFDAREYASHEELVALMVGADIVYGQMVDENAVRQAVQSGTRFIFDLYNAVPAEAIGSEKIGGFDTQPEMDNVYSQVLSFFRLCMRAGSYFVTSNERQRDFWIGFMLAAKGVMPSSLDGRAATDIVGLLPFGLEDEDPVQASHGIRGKRGIGDDDFVVLWAGGIWDWFDAETPIRAVAALRERRPNVHLVFYGTTHPNALIGRPASVGRAAALARDLGVLDVGVHFIEGWVPASERADYLRDADIAVCAHKDSLETRYAFRTRILDHFWSSLPSVVTEGDWFAEYIAENELGEVVRYGDVEQTATAIERLMSSDVRDQTIGHVQAIRDSWKWSATTRELVEIVANWEERLPVRDLRPIEEAITASHRRIGPLLRLRYRLSHTWVGKIYRRARGR
ncbi:hypothetical protein GCM10009808_02660 [Microbacterium sediminicola]|uniref:Glycosyltransferase n=1 Tax=Microbacterium sediminicola TaxID=415210 RepID=A0ABN2HLN7_9MICO